MRDDDWWGIHSLLAFSKRKRNGLLVLILTGLKFICMLWKVKSAFTFYSFSDGKDTHLEFLDFLKRLRAGRRSCTAKSWTGYYRWPMVVIAWDWLSGHCNFATERWLLQFSVWQSNVAATTATVVARYKRIEKLLENLQIRCFFRSKKSYKVINFFLKKLWT